MSNQLSTQIAQELKNELATTAKLLMMNPSCGASMQGTMEKYISKAERHFAASHPKFTARRLAKNTVKDLTEAFIRDFQR